MADDFHVSLLMELVEQELSDHELARQVLGHFSQWSSPTSRTETNGAAQTTTPVAKLAAGPVADLSAEPVAWFETLSATATKPTQPNATALLEPILAKVAAPELQTATEIMTRSVESRADQPEKCCRTHLLGTAKLAAPACYVPSRLWDRALREPLRDFLARPGKAFRARLVALAWQLAGGEGPPAPKLLMLIELIHAGSLIVDDIEDGSTHRRGTSTLHQLFGIPLAINSGNFLYFWPLVLLEQLELPPAVELEIRRALSRGMLRCHYGQALDLKVRVDELTPQEVPGVVAAVTQLKTGALMELAAILGVAPAPAAPEVKQAIIEFGLRLGIGLQMLDDLGNLTGAKDPTKHLEDVRNGRPTWPWAFLAQHTDEATFHRLQELAVQVRQGHAAAETLANELLDQIGTIGQSHIDDYLKSAWADLARVVGHRPELQTLADEIERLRRSY